ncbi:hypothetical protein [Micromonospora sp. RL09-050-HVF-A]|uniref:hypothetical protein n=1 Tax=Micromonospora sp. RL09-050-HVF-A TaxID=1703433 RepID=UPI001C5CE6BE|nr:hypothetical protein [Micromonospora sp. RL09-050-HVF-A]MBW4703546.1 hypothetical protein [Micromonospora sp. RL09-050-HVF-A]
MGVGPTGVAVTLGSADEASTEVVGEALRASGVRSVGQENTATVPTITSSSAAIPAGSRQRRQRRRNPGADGVGSAPVGASDAGGVGPGGRAAASAAARDSRGSIALNRDNSPSALAAKTPARPTRALALSTPIRQASTATPMAATVSNV